MPAALLPSASRLTALTLSVVALSGFTMSAHAIEVVKVRLDFLPYGLHAPFYLAKERGWFAEQGLDVEIEDGNGTGPALALVAAGKYDIAQVSLGALPIARDKGMPVKAIAAILAKGDFGAVVAEASGIVGPKDLEGRTVYYSAGSVETPFIDTYLQRAGVDKSKVNLVNIDIGAKISGYMSGQGDAMFAPVSLYTIPRVTPRASRGLLFTDYGIDVPSFGLVANESTIAKRPKVLGSFVMVFQRAWVAIKDGGAMDDGVAALIKNRPQAKLDPAVMKAQIQAVYPFLKTPATEGKPMLWMAPVDWASAVKIMEAAKLIRTGTKPETIYTNQFVPGL